LYLKNNSVPKQNTPPTGEVLYAISQDEQPFAAHPVDDNRPPAEAAVSALYALKADQAGLLA
jgi:hypothetical protein